MMEFKKPAAEAAGWVQCRYGNPKLKPRARSNGNRAQGAPARLGFREVEGLLPGPGIYALLEQR